MSSVITSADVQATAALARLGLTDEELKRATHDLANILSHFSSVQAIDTKNVVSDSDVTGLTNVSRADTVHADELCTPADLLDRAPVTLDGHVKVPAVF